MSNGEYSPATPAFNWPKSSTTDFGAIRRRDPDEDAIFQSALNILELIKENDSRLVVFRGRVTLAMPGADNAIHLESVRARLCKFNATLAPLLSIVDGALIFRYAVDA